MEAHYDDYTLTGLWRDQGTKGILLIAGIDGSPSGTGKQAYHFRSKNFYLRFFRFI